MKKSSILVVDDTSNNLRLLMDILVEQNYEVRLASNGSIALQSIQSSPPDLLLLDIIMPEMDGYEVCRRLKEDPQTQDIPVIFISALNELFDKVKAFSLGGVDYITKPFQTEEVLARVKTHLSHRHLQIELRAENKKRQIAEEKLQEVNLQLQEALQDQELQFASVMENLPSLMTIRDQDLRILYANKYLSEYFGIEQREGISTAEVYGKLGYPKTDIIEIERACLEALDDGPMFSELTLQTDSDDQEHIYQLIRFPIIRENKPKLLGTLFFDITDLKRTEAALNKSQHFLKNIIDSMPSLIICVDDKARITLWNKPAEAFFKMEGIDMADRSIEDLFSGIFHDLDDVIQAIKNRETLYKRSVPSTKQDRSVFYDITVFPLKGEKMNGAVVRLFDATEQVQIQASLTQNEKMKSLGEMSAGIAHEINNPNNYILLNITLIKEAWDSIRPILDRYYTEDPDFEIENIPYQEMQNHIATLFAGVKEGSQRIKQIVQSFRDYAYPESIIEKEEIQIGQVIDSSLVLLANLIKKSTNHLLVDIDGDIPSIWGNRQHLEQVFINLLQNACQSLSQSEQKINIKSSLDRTKTLLIIEIKDEGIGISANDVKRIQEPFFTKRRRQGGSGLGLYISSKVIEEHKGRLEFSSIPGEGTTVRVSLPISPA